MNLQDTMEATFGAVTAADTQGKNQQTKVQEQQQLVSHPQHQQQAVQAFPSLNSNIQQQQQLLLHNQQQNYFSNSIIPTHLQTETASLAGTPGHPPALIVNNNDSTTNNNTTNNNTTDHCSFVYNGVNPNYPGLRVLCQDPPVFAVDDFLTLTECNFLITHAHDCLEPAPVVGEGAGEIHASRTSSTCYFAREDLPALLQKVTHLTGKPWAHCELPQVGRYLPTQQYMQHYDAFDLTDENGRRFAANGGQRVVTVLTYLNDVQQGGATCFPNLKLQVQPKAGMCVVFFPSSIEGTLDPKVLHAAMPAVDVKYVNQVWIRQGEYHGTPSKRLAQTM